MYPDCRGYSISKIKQTINKEKNLMEEALYFVPEITDFRIGYECEANITVFKVKDQWNPCTIRGVGPEVIEHHKKGVYRTPYLTKEQIEAEGWNKHAVIKNNWFREDIEGKGILYLTKEEEYIIIEDDRDGVFLFRGLCKSINEFRTIQKLLGI